MADSENYVVTPMTMARIFASLKYTESMRQTRIPNGTNGNRGPSFGVNAPRPSRPQVIQPAGIVRIASNYTGQGKYLGYLQSSDIPLGAGTNAGTLQNVTLSNLGVSDAERVILWNAFENDLSGTTTGTNRTHLLGPNQFITGGIFYGIEVVEGATNTARVVLINWLPALGCGE